MSLVAGTRLGPYEIIEPIGKGGMGEVYRARDTKLDRDVAIKVLPEEFAKDKERLARFEREAKLLASLNHPNIASIYGLEETAGVIALILELVEGPTLAERIAEGPIPVEEALPIARQIAEALEAGHEAGVIHRDVKPANVKVKEDGTVKVLDYGLAKALEGEAASGTDAALSQSPTLTRHGTEIGVILGTAAYMSPEQAKGKRVDTRTDVWAFGAVLYEMLAGERAFKGDDVSDTLVAVFRDEPDWTKLPHDTPPRIPQALRVCLNKDAKARVRDVAAVRLAMDGAFETQGADTPESSAARVRPLWHLAIVGLGVFAAGGLAVWMAAPEASPLPVSRFVVSPSAPPRVSLETSNVAISPDGRRIVYTTGTSRQLYLRSLDQLEGVEDFGGFPVSAGPFFSPDGMWIGFATFTDVSHKKISVLGGAAVTLWNNTSSPRGAAWGQDGTIIFGHNRPGSGLLRGRDSGGELEFLTTLDEAGGEQHHWWPELLPGGEAVLFTIIRGPTDADHDIAVLDLATGAREVLIRGGSFAQYASTGHLVFATADALMGVGFDPARRTVLGNPVPLLSGRFATATGAANYDLSETGSLVYVSGLKLVEQRSLVWVDRMGNEEVVPAEPLAYNEFTLSPDGSRVAVRVGTRASADVWLYDLARNTSTRLTFDPGEESYPTWTPDGSRVAFGMETGPLSWKMSNGTGNVEPVGEIVDEYPHAFTPDGASVIYERSPFGERSDIGVLSLEGERRSTLLVDSAFGERNPALSGDGRWLAYESDESGRTEVYVRPFPDVNAARWQITTNGGRWPVWSPNSNELFYRGRSGVFVHDFETEPSFRPGKSEFLFTWEFVTGTARRIAVSPDGTRFLMLKDHVDATEDGDAQKVQVVLVENWFEELKRLVPAND